MTGTKNAMRANTIKQLEAFTPSDPKEADDKAYILSLLAREERCFWRDCFPDHITASALLISPCGSKTLLNYHKSLNKWLCFGGHCDGDPNVQAGALREVQEESGIKAVQFMVPAVVDVDRHMIPANAKKNEPAHYHCDFRFLLQAETEQFEISDESTDLRWCNYDEAMELAEDMTMRRLLSKWHKI